MTKATPAMLELHPPSFASQMSILQDLTEQFRAFRPGTRSRALFYLRTGALDGEGQRQIIGVDLANRESRSSWRDFLSALKERGLFGVEFVVSDDHPGLKQAIREVLPSAAWQRCYVHFLRNALDHLPRKLADDCLQEAALDL